MYHEYNEEDNRFIASSTLIASNEDSDKNHDDISDIGDNSDWTLTSGESSNEEDEDFNNSSLPDLGTISIGNRNRFNKDYNLANRLQRQETPLVTEPHCRGLYRRALCSRVHLAYSLRQLRVGISPPYALDPYDRSRNVL